uniref:Uncharacterized protein n=1 Tax=Corethron hystrix TaxID=216773 RepID=A0A7S1FTM5_9STRA|mmetsp:Transcript_3091/g.5796  ORF Transcript_3091/g.5796 Transcript_3091/m.5796 type:complete len:251 (+) Transcript_3091:298-1050(+)|eukprot:CAMPEP_0113300518 /NCGR_PEP_ID=MMETSP0010_2-20120614/2114_1 /TAXON_ID=216773 ORGANISM="Corethron hystrix, Strain 308" /NCGR_SAMPLE_ID=MMETSP0010_2 /ASSEMBLY_ACC=CAM_ASM_000155 /LENGTH=250 /DNA_ID=CAMNT_0000153955 /DNA_START=183 /DNA_END=935 /DNA_ORIENTATION=+ /assembly_acc=CAM_ASM_000155
MASCGSKRKRESDDTITAPESTSVNSSRIQNPGSGSRTSFPVFVYRRTLARGWEFYHTGSTESPKYNQNDSAEVSSSTENVIDATVRVGCIEIRALRLRISLFENDGDTKKCTKTIVRRGDRVLISTGKAGVVMLQFRSLKESVEFGDVLYELNAHKNNEGEKWAKSCDATEKSLAVPRGVTMGDDKGFMQSSDLSGQISGLMTQMCQREDVLSYVVRLMYDDDFLKLVDGMEKTINTALGPAPANKLQA